ncbi:MAG: cobalamin transport system ATP-binding protein [Acidobacteriota bacterium]|jgi:iron complex transport system ATP-binding protein|nr:cobalamin transport system ATP-binding protein [Acidobacteriota bacterium]MDT7778958.1 cobalamin transport system ATP-binding protein [Acidobacteriota bacterium]
MSAVIKDEGGGAGALVEARSLRFAYSGSGAEVVRGVSLAVGRGRLSALIGANGSGKSTLIRLLAGLLKPSGGEVLFGGVPLARIEARERARRFAYVPQTVSTVFPFTALEVVLTGRSPYTTRFRFESGRDVEVARAALAAVDAAHLEARPVTELSGGERQLVALARALAQEPECLLLDEPSAALDLKHRAGLIRHLRRLRDEQGMTALIVTHDLMLLDPAFDRVFAMHCGEVAAEGTPPEVLREEVLASIYGDEHVRARQAFGRTFIWSEL